MKRFGNYQYVEGEVPSERDKQEMGSKFWNEGKWDNFIVPFLPKNCKGLTLVDMGCNAGLFLKLAKDRGFSTVIGIERNKEAFSKALAYKERNKRNYELRYQYMERCIDHLPMSDITVIANGHYYLLIDHWLEYLDKLIVKSRYCIIVTAEKKRANCKASPFVVNIRKYFKCWKETGIIDDVPLEGDPFPRPLISLCFKSPYIDRIAIDNLYNDNDLQVDFYKELDKGVNPLDTSYFKILRETTKKNWPQKRLERYMFLREELYQNVKKRGVLNPIIINNENVVLDGKHRCFMTKHLGHKSILVRRV